MRAITVLQPWASLIAVGAKRYETRSWKTGYRGPLAIHAALDFPAAARALCKLEPFASALLGNEDLPLGCVVATCNLAAVFATADEESLFEQGEDWPASERAFGDFSPGRYAWLLQNVRALEVPVPARGKQSLWEWNAGELGLLLADPKSIMKNQSPPKQYRQGDVLIEEVRALPGKLKPPTKENGRVILAHGEVTGHAHEISPPKLATLHEMEEAVRLLGDTDGAEAMTRTALLVKKAAKVVHQEHSTIPLPPGEYVVTRQREYSPEAILNVAD